MASSLKRSLYRYALIGMCFFLLEAQTSHAEDETSSPKHTEEEAPAPTPTGEEASAHRFENKLKLPAYGRKSDISQVLAATTTELMGVFNTKYPNPISRIISLGLIYSVTNANAEMGRVTKAEEFGGKIGPTSFAPVFVGGGLCSPCILPEGIPPQKIAMVYSSPIEAHRMASYAAVEQLLKSGEEMTPSQGVATAINSTAQLTSIYLTKDSDIENYVKYMNVAYGDGSMTTSQIKEVAWLEALNPVIYTSIYSAITNNDAPLKNFEVGGVKFLPSVNVILTPYGAIEKRVVTYLPGESSNLNFSVGYGKDPLGRSTNYFEGGSDDVYSIAGVKIGANVATWRQPDLSAESPLNSEMKQGFMTKIVADYKMLDDHLNIQATFTCKTSGFIQGQPISRSCTTLVTTEWKW